MITCSQTRVTRPLLLLTIGIAAALSWPAALAAQGTPSLTIDDDVTAIAYAPDGRLAYAVRHTFHERKIEMQRDDIWIAMPDGKRTRIVNGEKMFRGPAPFSYAVQSLRWSPDSLKLAIDVFTSVMTDERGETREGMGTLLLDDSGHEIKGVAAETVIPESTNAAWLPDGVTVAFLHEAVSPKLLFSIRALRPAAGRGDTRFPDLAFITVAWDQRRNASNAAVAVERDRDFSGPMRLVWLDLAKESRRELARLESFAGQLSISPSGTRVAYFRDQETLEVREIDKPERVARVRVAMGNYVWSADERRILLKRGYFETPKKNQARRSGTLVWVTIPPTQPQAEAASLKDVPDAELQLVLSGLLYQSFAISPDGRRLAVVSPGGRPLQVFPIQ